MDSPPETMDRQSVEGAINKVSKAMQEATEEKRARFPDLRQMLDDLGVQNGDNATTATVDAAVDWLDLEGQKGISDAVERDRQDIAIEHIHETAGDGTYDSEDDGDHKENERDCGSPEELQRSLDCIDEFATLTDNPLVSHHVREIREHVRKIREEVARTFHGGKEAENGETGGSANGSEDQEMLVSVLLDSAEEGTLRTFPDVAAHFDDYLPDASLPASQRDGLYDDLLRDAAKYFAMNAAEEDEEDGSADEVDPGCCLLCERIMPLTRHHVMPRSTHKRYQKRGYTDEVLNRTIDVCRPCHSAIHRAHDARTLAERFTTREQLLADEEIRRFVAWARKQRTTTKADAKNNLLRYRR